MRTLRVVAFAGVALQVGSCGVAGIDETFGARGAPVSADAGAGGSSSGGAGAGGAATTSGQGGQAHGGTGQGGAGGVPDPTCGCSDGFREAFIDRDAQPNLAGCAGAFDVPGVTTDASLAPACDRQAGDDGANRNGMGCSVEDLCSAGWHVCKSAAELGARSTTGGCEAADPGTPAFWLTRQAQTGSLDGGAPDECAAAPAIHNLTGCGSLGQPSAASCAPLLRTMRQDDCIPTQAWYCGDGVENGLDEARIVRKTRVAEGGVVCCRG